MKRLLSVDFDYFFPVRTDWATSEVGVVASLGAMLWTGRASEYLRRGEELPQVTGHESFWDRVSVSPTAKAVVADSHFRIWPLIKRGWEVLSIDAHHDAGYGDAITHWDCSNWVMRAATKGIRVDVRYPAWRADYPEGLPSFNPRSLDIDDGAHLGTFDAIFVCRSGGWVPSWCDDEFAQFVSAIPCPVRFDPKSPATARPFSMDEARSQAAEFQRLVEDFQRRRTGRSA